MSSLCWDVRDARAVQSGRCGIGVVGGQGEGRHAGSVILLPTPSHILHSSWADMNYLLRQNFCGVTLVAAG